MKWRLAIAMCLASVAANAMPLGLRTAIWGIAGNSGDSPALMLLTVESADESMGTVNGVTGEYLAGTKVTLRATPAKGYVFAGWHKGDAPLATETDYRTTSINHITDSQDETIEAWFVSVQDDKNIEIAVEDCTLAEDGGADFSLGDMVVSHSLPSISVSGLPKGLKFDSKTNKITGTATVPGTYTVKVSVKNTSVKDAVTNTFKIKVPNWRPELFDHHWFKDEYDVYAGMLPEEIDELLEHLTELTQIDGWTIKGSGLPGGLSYKAATKTHEATMTGTANKEGEYTVYFEASKKGVATQKASTTFKVTFPALTVDSEDETKGTVTGSGNYQVGTKVTLKATPKKGYVFAGWYLGGVPLEGSADYRTTSFEYITTIEDVEIEGWFVQSTEDMDITIDLDDDETEADGKYDLDLSERVKSQSLPKITVSGLPNGLKFDSKTNKISGKATAPGKYTVTVSATNTTVKKSETNTFKLTVPNWKPELFTDWLEDEYPTLAGVWDEYTWLLGDLKTYLYDEDWLVKVSGLPTGLKYSYNSKTGEASITGFATKEGDYTMYIEASKKGETTQKATATISVTFPELKVVSENEDRGTVTGGGKYPAGKKVTLKATPKKGYVFAGWYVGDDPLEVEGGDDYRKASYSYTTTAEATTITGKFVTVDEDKLEEKIILHYEPLELYAASNPVDEKVVVESYSLPSVSVANLPTGMKFDAKTMKITGAPSKQGEQKNVMFTIKNESNKTGKQVVKTMRVGDAVAKGLDLLYNKVPGVDGYDLLVPGAKVDKDLLGMGDKLVGWSVSGLPAGVKFDSKTGEFSGAATKSGTKYLVTLTKGSGSEKQTATITLETKPDPKLVLMKYLMLRGDDDKNEAAEAMAEFPSLFVVTGGGNYPVGKKVTISATAPEDWVFLGWMEPYDCIGDKTKLMQFAKHSKCTIEMPTPDENNEVRLLAVFTYLADDIEVYTEDMHY